MKCSCAIGFSANCSASCIAREHVYSTRSGASCAPVTTDRKKSAMKVQAPFGLPNLPQNLAQKPAAKNVPEAQRLSTRSKRRTQRLLAGLPTALRGLFSGASRRPSTRHGTHVALHGRGNDARRGSTISFPTPMMLQERPTLGRKPANSPMHRRPMPPLQSL